jgi:tRNA nucleotidyltransferase (CCA-adding enzyme)
MDIFLVGGAVRDKLLNRKPNDLDYCMLAKSYSEMKQYLLDNNYTIFQERPQYFTIKAKCPKTNKTGDFTLCRKDGFYSDHRRPDTVEIGSIHDDLSRRDFTINAIAQNTSTQELIDPYNGQQDLSDKIIRCVNNSYDRFYEDPLRLIRALRFAVQLKFALHPDIIECLKNKKLYSMLTSVSLERKMVELNKMFKADTVYALTLLKDLPADFYEYIFDNDKIWLQTTNKLKN